MEKSTFSYSSSIPMLQPLTAAYALTFPYPQSLFGSAVPVKMSLSAQFNMAFFTSAVGTLQTFVVALGAGLGIWGAINLMEGYGNDNPGAKSQGMKQLMAGGGVALIGTTLVPLLSGLF